MAIAPTPESRCGRPPLGQVRSAWPQKSTKDAKQDNRAVVIGCDEAALPPYSPQPTLRDLGVLLLSSVFSESAPVIATDETPGLKT